jgi:hypothetical protein
VYGIRVHTVYTPTEYAVEKDFIQENAHNILSLVPLHLFVLKS